MDIKIIEPFLKATIDCFETMMNVIPRHIGTTMTAPPLEGSDIAAIIGLSGDAQGMVCVSFHKDVALRVVEQFLGEKPTEINSDVFDAIGEVINIIAGNAKALIQGLKLSISLPTVMHGEKFYMSLPKDATVLSIRFELPDIGEFNLIVTMKQS